MIDLAALPDIALYGAFAAAALVVWFSGRKLPDLAARIGAKTGIGQAFAGMLLLGGITTLPELATTTSAAAAGAGDLALNNIFGSVAFNLLLLAFADVLLKSRALTASTGRSATLLQGACGITLLGFAALVILLGDVPLGQIGLGSGILFALCLGAMRLASQHESRRTWAVVDSAQDVFDNHPPDTTASLRVLLRHLGGLAALILLGGVVLSQSGDAIAERTGLGESLIGFVLVAMGTSLPELAVIAAAVRRGHYELAIGDAFGANLFNLAMIFIIDLVLGEPVLTRAGTFEATAALTGLLITGVFLIGLLERRDRTVLRMGYDSVAAILIYSAGLAFLAHSSG